MSQTSPKRKSKSKTGPASPHLLPRCIAGLRAPTIPLLGQHPNFTQKTVNDAKVVLMAILDNKSTWQVTKQQVRDDTGFSDKRTTKALQYLRIQQIVADVVVRKSGKLHGWCLRVDLDGKVEKGGWVIHHSQSEDVYNDYGAARKSMRRAAAGLESKKPKASKRRKPQSPLKQGGTETASPSTSYNDIPVGEEEKKKKRPLYPLPGRFKPFFQKPRRRSRRGSWKKLKSPTLRNQQSPRWSWLRRKTKIRTIKRSVT